MKEKKVFKTKYGYFTENGEEYVITSPKTPRPWVNVIANENYGFVVSQTGGGFSWFGNSQLSRLNIWYQDLVRDAYGRYVYVRDNNSGDFWSTTWKPTEADYTSYEVRYGLGYAKFTAVKNNIRTEQLMFVPRNENFEIWRIKVKNFGKVKKSLTLFSFLELCLGNGTDTHREFQKTFIETEIDKKTGVIYGRKRPALVPGFISTGAKDEPLSAFLAVLGGKNKNFDGDSEAFLGKYGSYSRPEAVAKGKLSPKRIIEKWGDPIFSSSLNLDLKPGEEKEIAFILGVYKKKSDVRKVVEKYKRNGKIEEDFNEVKDFWASLTEASWIETPDKAMNFLTNKWYRYQALSARMWAKTGYYQCSGGIGFRDQLQDSNCLLEVKPELTRKQILIHAEQQFPDGTVYHWWHPGTGIGAHTGMSDDLLWLVFISLNYYDETGDFSVFKEVVPFVEIDGRKEKGTIYEHCKRAIDKVLSRWSKRGLPLIGEGDWNDGMSHVGIKWKGESIWLGHFLYGILNRFCDICEKMGDRERGKCYVERAKKLKKAVNKYGWDGKWYIRATRDSGVPLGSKSERRGKIFLNAQSWAVLNDVAEGDRGEIAMKSAYKYLFKQYGPLLFTPGYDKIDYTIGYLSRYAPSVRENGGVYTHAACWGVAAAAKLKDADMAYSGYRNMCPVYRSVDNPDLYMAEPYVTPGNVDGPDSEKFGRGGWTWYSGSGSWMQKVAYNWICGIRAERDGLVIDPVIPKEWKFFRAKRKYRGHTYYIEVKNPESVNSGVKEIYLDGVKLGGNFIVPSGKNNVHEVIVVMGK